ncbi:hypothetical protein [Treponema putidum]|uniref:hypothetical protein n=1 Tax=Treponema putidum TaxID=221027 RepID=UPI003D90BEB4
MGNKKMQNISTVKVNPYEIAKAPDMDFGFKNILANASILADRFFGYHSPLPFTHSTLGDILQDRDRKDFIIGGGLIPDGNQMLRPLPIVAFSNYGGLFISNGLDVENRPYQIPLGVDFENEGWRIESIYIGNAFDDEKIQGEQPSQKKDPNWDEYASEWRASYKIGNTSEDTVFAEFKKRQMQAVRFYVYPGAIEDDKKYARAADTSSLEVFKTRVKIAEVLVHCVLDSGNFPRIQPITKDDIRFVTAVQYWEGKVGNTIDPSDIDNYSSSNPTAVGEDNKWVQKAPTVEPNYQPGATVEEMEKARLEAEQKNLNNRAYRAEHYNYRWTNEHTRTYRIGSIAEVSERLYKIHQSDGTLKEGVVWHKHINLTSEDRNGLKGSLIPVDSPEQNIALPLGGKIVSYESIKQGLLAVATAMFKQDEKADGINKKIDNVDNRLNSKIDNHIQQVDAHGATSSPKANRIAIRDGAGRFEVENPVTDKQVVNISYLNDTFKLDIVMKVLMSKYITTQEEFDRWINQKQNKAYTYVYLNGDFTASKTINLSVIGTKEVIGRGDANINIIIDDMQTQASTICGIKSFKVPFSPLILNSSLKNINVNVSARRNDKGTVTAVYNCTCYNCEINIKGQDNVPNSDNGYTRNYGVSVVGLAHCNGKNIKVTAIGGRGRDGRDGSDDWNGKDGESGLRGGHAWSILGGGFTNINYERVVGGDGGSGGDGGDAKTPWGTGGDGGDGGNGGDAHGITGSGSGGKGGSKGSGGDGGKYNANGSNGDPGKDGTYYYITG